jgi:hypothetical protein
VENYDTLDYIGTIVCILLGIGIITLVVSCIFRQDWKHWSTIVWTILYTSGAIIVVGGFLKACNML